MYNRIKELREDHDKSQKEISAVLNISQGNYSFIENGVANLKADDLKKLAVFYNVSSDYILELTDIKTPYPQK